MTPQFDAILTDSLADPWGLVSAADHDTAHLVRTWARDQDVIPVEAAERAVQALLLRQRARGGWGPDAAPAPYHLVPTLSALTGLLAARTARRPLPCSDMLPQAIIRGLAYLTDSLADIGPDQLPDTVAVEYLVPALLEQLDTYTAPAEHHPWQREVFHETVRGLRHRIRRYHDKLATLRARVESGATLPVQAVFSIDVLSVPPAVPLLEACGLVASSPSATCSVLGRQTRADAERAIDSLTELQNRLDGALPAYSPITPAERFWLVGNALRIHVPVPAHHVGPYRRYLLDNLGSGPVATGPGLPPDADTTAGLMFALARLGTPVSPALLDTFREPDHYATYPGESTRSVSTNAHVLEALGTTADHRGPDARHPASTPRDWLLANQNTDGSWSDKWHASPYYATVAAAIALHAHGGPAARSAVERAERWVLTNRRDDGAFGMWCSTIDETAHATQFLLAYHGRPTPHDRSPAAQAIRSASAFLGSHRRAAPDDPARTPLWHAKELYEPTRIVDGLTCAVLAAASESI